MRSISSKILTVLCLFAGGMAAMAQPVQLLHATNTIWRFYHPTNDPGFNTEWKDPLFGDSGPEWNSGAGLFGTETTVYPYPIRTVVPPTGNPATGPLQAFFRVHFNWASSTQGVLLTFTNYIDDGMVVFLNGTEIYRFNITGNPGDPVVFSTTPPSPTANPGGEPVTQVATVDPTAPASGIPATLIQGDNVLAVYVGQAGTTSSDVVFGMWMYGSQAIPVSIQHPPAGGTNVTVPECVNAVLNVVASGVPSPTYQWNYLGSPITGQTGPSLTVTNVKPGINDGVYTVDVTNPSGTVTSPNFTVTASPLDTTGPVLVKAEVNTARTQVIVSYNEPLAAPIANDEFAFRVQPAAGTDLNAFAVPVLQNGTNLIIELRPGEWIETEDYILFDDGSGARDACNSTPSLAGSIPVNVPFLIRQGLNGYAGAVDIEIHMNTDAGPTLADTPNATAASISVDLQDGTLAGVNSAAVGLLRFNDIFGNGPNQIPLGATINSATLTINQVDAGSANNAYRMLVDWDANSTWNTLNNGVTNDGVEAMITADFAVPNVAGTPARNFNVLAALQAWQGGQPNYGWAFISTGTDGFDFASSDNATETLRPQLRVEFTAAPDSRLGIQTQPPANITIDERATLSISLVVTGNNPNFQWQKQIGGVFTDISGATEATYSKTGAIPADSGTYRARACNSINCVTSTVTVVQVNADNIRPTVSLTSVGLDATTLTLLFSEDVTSAGTYQISPNVGITSATLGADNQTVTVVTGPRTFRTQYTLTVSGAADTAATANTMLTTNVNFEQDSLVITGFFDDWKYETNNLDGSAWTTNNNAVFDDSLWFVGPGIFGFEPGGAGSNTLRNAGLTLEANGYQPATRLDVNTNQPTYYFRKAVTVPSITLSDTAFELHHYIDDGAVGHVNGIESFRFGFTNNIPITFTNYSAGAPVGGEATLQTNILNGMVVGNNLVAVEVHQQNATSSDVVFGGRIVAVHRIARPLMTITRSGSNVTVSWTPAVGTLQQSSDLINWTTSSRVNGVAAPATGNLFFRVLR